MNSFQWGTLQFSFILRRSKGWSGREQCSRLWHKQGQHALMVLCQCLGLIHAHLWITYVHTSVYSISYTLSHFTLYLILLYFEFVWLLPWSCQRDLISVGLPCKIKINEYQKSFLWLSGHKNCMHWTSCLKD